MLGIILQSDQRIIGLMFLLAVALRLFTVMEFVLRRQAKHSIATVCLRHLDDVALHTLSIPLPGQADHDQLSLDAAPALQQPSKCNQAIGYDGAAIGYRSDPSIYSFVFSKEQLLTIFIIRKYSNAK